MSTPADGEYTGRHSGIEALRRTRRRIADDDVERVLERLERGGITPLAAGWLRRERRRPATLSAEGLLAGLFLAAADNRGAVVLTRVTDTLYFEISPRMRARFGISPSRTPTAASRPPTPWYADASTHCSRPATPRHCRRTSACRAPKRPGCPPRPTAPCWPSAVPGWCA